MKVIGWTFLIFCGLVAVNYASLLAGNFLSYGGGWMRARADSTSGGLTAIDFSLFDKNGTGKSYITQGYGHTPFSYKYPNGWHDGIDIGAVYGAPIYTPGAGTVLATGNQDNYCPGKGFGKYVAVDDTTNHLILWFAHLGTIAVSPGKTIAKGALVGTVGSTGFETGTHLHFSIFDAGGFTMTPRGGCGPEPTGRDVNPLSYLGTTYQ